jgi:hypothetical protein
MSDFNYRGKLPFRVVSSSVNTGYNAELTAAVGHNIEIVNQHRDEYGALQDAPLQGPFTEQWVGGNQHRHIDLNDGADNSSNRPEAFLVSGSTDKVRVYGPTHFDISAPKALLTRDGVSKSPVNLKNIRNESRRLGNFSHNYQVVQTSGRDINQSLIENNLTASGVLTTKFIKGVQEYSLPEEPNNKTVFVERFSAPGDYKESSRGALDRESEQYSPNNSLVTRNIAVRQKYNSQLTQHSAQFNSGSAEGITVHAVNRNTIKNIELSGTTFVTASDYDNFWVQHAIPSTDLRYSWIAESVVDTGSVIQYQNPYDSQELVFNSSSFVVSGTNKQFPIDNNGINSLIKDKKSVDLVTNTFNVSSSVKLSASFSEIANSSYQYPSWRQIRTGEHPVARKLKENNIVSIEDTKSKVISGIQTVSRHSDTVLNYTEAPVTNKFKPLQQVLELKGNGQKYNFKFTHINNLSTFANKDIVDRLGIDEDSQQTYDLLRKYYSDPNRANDPQNPVSKLESYTYSETLYPREVNAYLAETRGRTQYILDQAGTASRDGYDIQLGTQRAFWRDRLEDRKRSSDISLNSMNYLQQKSDSFFGSPSVTVPNSYQQNELQFNPLSDYKVNGAIGRKEGDISVENFYYSIKPFDNGDFSTSSYSTFFTKLTQPSQPPPVGPIANKFIIVREFTNGLSGELNNEIFLDYYYTSSDIPNGSQLVRVTQNSVLNQYEYRTGSFNSYRSYSSYLLDPNDNTKFLNAPIPRPNFVAFIGGLESGSRDCSVTTPAVLAQFNIETYNFFNNQPTDPIISTLDSGLRYASESFGNKKPWFDSYEKYSDDIRSYAKDHSVLSEFRMSSNIPFYVTQNGGNFRIKNTSFLEIDGVGENYRSSLTASNPVYNVTFVNSYARTDVLDNRVIQTENSSLTKLDSIKFTVSGIKKLLPYNGFYPQERTIQLANLFNDFLDNNIAGGYFKFTTDGTLFAIGSGSIPSAAEFLLDTTSSADIFYKNTVLPYYFSPGILYNTIKSGISTDFPGILATDSFFDYLVNIDNNLTGPIRRISSITRNKYIKEGVSGSILRDNLINVRVPFESLIFPQNFIPVRESPQSFQISSSYSSVLEIAKDKIANTLLNIRFDAIDRTDAFTFPNIGATWKHSIPFAYLKNNVIIDPSYSLAMSNFLAEIPKFFLRNGSMNVFRSAELKDWKTFELGKKYYFDLKMKKSSDLVMVEAYRSQYHITGTGEIEKTFNGRYFGWPTNKVSGTISDLLSDNYVIHNDPAYAPFTPPYFEGEATLRFELIPTSASYNSVKDLQNDIVLTDVFDALGQVIETGSEAYINKMSIQDCMEVFGIGLNPITTFNNLNNTDNFQQLPDSSKEYWAISPKLETPVLDFSDQEFVEHTGSYWVSSGYGRGMWSGYGKIPTGSKGITIEIAESFPLKTGFRTNRLTDNLKTGSLLKQVGFNSETAKIGQLADKKTISEAVMMIPYVDKPISGVTTQIDGHHFFAINPFIFDSQKRQVETNTLENGETSITKMIRLMKQYVIPPNFDFLKHYNNPNLQTIRDNREGIDPFVMYLFEFKHDLDQQDLADIWQGVMPKIAISAEHDIVEFGHKIGPLELFGENFTPPENLRWMVFKVKKKAEWNYFAITENISDDQNFVFKFANSEEARTPDYSYNWPYDYFSLVELAKIDISLRYDERPLVTGSLQTDININQFAIGNITDFRDIHSGTTTPRRRRVQGGSRRRNTKKTSGKKK